jgi:hypothetical protein
VSTTSTDLHGTGQSNRRPTTINMLSDDILLGVFNFCRDDHPYFSPVWDWHLLVHVCRKWRQIVFASPHGLNLKILCTHKTPVRKHLCVWPAFPIAIDHNNGLITPDDEDNILAALDSEHLDRVCFVGLSVTGSQLGKIVAVTQKPFPALNCLQIFLNGGGTRPLPGGFLGGSAPRLQRITLSGVSYPALPTLLLSARSLVELELGFEGSCRTDYISPKAMAASLSALPMLEKFTIEYRGAAYLPDQIRPPPSRAVLPALTSFQFRGASKYLEDLVARIEGPQLIAITIAYSEPPGDFPVAQLIEFIDRSVCPRSAIFRRAHVAIFNHHVSLTFHRQTTKNLHRDQRHDITCDLENIHWKTTHFAQAFSHVSAALTSVVHLELMRGPGSGGVDDVQWRHLLQHFSNVQTLKLCGRLSWRMVRTLQDITEETQVAGLFASLELIFLQDEPASSIENFVALRKQSGHILTVVNTQTEFDERLKSYVT